METMKACWSDFDPAFIRTQRSLNILCELSHTETAALFTISIKPSSAVRSFLLEQHNWHYFVHFAHLSL